MPVVIEATDGEQGKSASAAASGVRQLCGYMLRMFEVQVDRRFAFGLVFRDPELSVWLCDRSGLLGTRTSIHIHKVSTLISYPDIA